MKVILNNITPVFYGLVDFTDGSQMKVNFVNPTEQEGASRAVSFETFPVEGSKSNLSEVFGGLFVGENPVFDSEGYSLTHTLGNWQNTGKITNVKTFSEIHPIPSM